MLRTDRPRSRHTVLGYAVHLPGRSAADLPGSPVEPACGPDDAHLVLGRKGLLGKEASTRLALCAVHRMFGLPPGRPADPLPGAARTAVVVASNLGNVETVCRVVDEVRDGGVRAVSPLDAPNASSNVIASTIAIWYGFTGPNLAVCSGATAGLDAVRLGQLLLAADRADRVVVVGVEPVDPVATALAGAGLLAGAGAVLLGPAPTDPSPWCGPVRRTDAPELARRTDAPELARRTDAPELARRTDAPEPDGDGDGLAGLYGAAGVVRLAVAAARAGSGDAGTVTVGCGDAEDGWASVEVGRG